jgi:hypothetical protein
MVFFIGTPESSSHMPAAPGGIFLQTLLSYPDVPSTKTSHNDGSTVLNAWGKCRGKPPHISQDLPAGIARAQNAKKICPNLARN